MAALEGKDLYAVHRAEALRLGYEVPDWSFLAYAIKSAWDIKAHEQNLRDLDTLADRKEHPDD